MDASQPVAPWRVADTTRRARTPQILAPQILAPQTLASQPSRRRVTVRLFLPLTPIALLLAPFALLLAMLCTPVWPLTRVNPFAAALAVGRLLLALGGTEVRVDAPAAFVRIRIV